MSTEPKICSRNAGIVQLLLKACGPQVALHRYIKTKGEELITDEKKDPEMVELLLSMKQRMDTVLSTSFHKNEVFGHALKVCSPSHPAMFLHLLLKLTVFLSRIRSSSS